MNRSQARKYSTKAGVNRQYSDDFMEVDATLLLLKCYFSVLPMLHYTHGRDVSHSLADHKIQFSTL